MEKLHRAKFVIDSLPDFVFEGYTSSDTWNGWACPFFEKTEAERVLKASEVNNFSWKYDPNEDVFIVQNKLDPEMYEPEEFEATTITTDDNGEIIVYGIGAYSWIWEIDENL